MRYQKSIVGKWFLRKMCFDHLRWMAQGFLTETTSRSKYYAKKKDSTTIWQQWWCKNPSIHPSISSIHLSFFVAPGTIPIRPNVLLEVNVVSHLYPPAQQNVLKNLHLGPMPDRCRTDAVDAVKMAWWWWKIFNQPPPKKIVGVFTNIICWFGKKIVRSPFFDWFHQFEMFFLGGDISLVVRHILEILWESSSSKVSLKIWDNYITQEKNNNPPEN